MKSMSLKSNEVLWSIEVLAGFFKVGFVWIGFAVGLGWDCRGVATIFVLCFKSAR